MAVFRTKPKFQSYEHDTAPLAPVYPPIRVFAGCTLPVATTLVMSSKIAWIKDARVTTPHGQPLFALNNKHRSLRRAFTLDNGKSRYALIERPNTAMKLTLVASLADTIDARTLTLVGSNNMDAATITLDTGQVAAQLSYECWKRRSRHTYTAHIAPGVDVGLVTALMIAWDTTKMEIGAVSAS